MQQSRIETINSFILKISIIRNALYYCRKLLLILASAKLRGRETFCETNFVVEFLSVIRPLIQTYLLFRNSLNLKGNCLVGLVFVRPPGLIINILRVI